MATLVEQSETISMKTKKSLKFYFLQHVQRSSSLHWSGISFRNVALSSPWMLVRVLVCSSQNIFNLFSLIPSMLDGAHCAKWYILPVNQFHYCVRERGNTFPIAEAYQKKTLRLEDKNGKSTACREHVSRWFRIPHCSDRHHQNDSTADSASR